MDILVLASGSPEGQADVHLAKYGARPCDVRLHQGSWQAVQRASHREAGETCSKHRVARLMRQANLRAAHGYRTRRWAAGKPSVLIPHLLQRQFTVTRPNTAWVTDITYIRTWQGWLYLAVVMDLYSRKIVGWATAPTIHRELVLNAVLMAVRRRRPRGTLIHSDQGTQFGSDAWRRFCRSNRLEPSMSRNEVAGTTRSRSRSSAASRRNGSRS